MSEQETRANPIAATVDFERDGLQHGFLRLPYSRDDSAWGAVMIPVTVAKNGKGPTVLLTGANHGDEYEGPVALMDLAASIDAASLTGRVIILPAMNFPAFRAATRTSPIDQGNLNRSFPGKPDGTVTQKIADYFQRTLLPLADVVLDIHSGGKTLEFVPFCCAHRLPDPAQEQACVAAMQAFNAPYSMMLLEIDSVGMYDTAAEAMGKVFISTELGGGGSTSARTVGVAKRGVRNLLVHAGVMQGELARKSSVMLDMPDGDCFSFSEQDGLIEPCVDLGEAVGKGDLIARIWPADRTGVKPVEVRARMSGLAAGRHFPGLVKTGDCISVLAVAA
ncbi:N(2)-acetyl-L-2,4-diaminobutanoate deacetylase DoeB [Dongia sp.]|uniref:N(2)-acetyl-L-2,4-diaminobutanoate deacetylase DoeB n=1 Tax=Dongia sp. TaxID=1977262 RepID=UPI0037518754